METQLRNERLVNSQLKEQLQVSAENSLTNLETDNNNCSGTLGVSLVKF